MVHLATTRACGAAYLLLLLVGACAATQEAGQPVGAARAQHAPALPSRIGPGLLPDGEAVGLVQLYQGEDERQWPILRLGSRDYLTLSFDLLAAQARPLSIYFYHADYRWQRDLLPAEYLASFHRDDLLAAEPSIHTDLAYQHYVYRFPNESVQFRLSGNYILRVTEQGQEDAVLFERAFFVVEPRLRVELAFDAFLGGQAAQQVRPLARFQVPVEMSAAVFDFTVCFARNGSFEAVRCSRRPLLDEQPMVSFTLAPGEAFPPEPADYFLDLSTLQPGGRIQRVDRGTQPPEVWLEPDYVRFGGSDVEPLLAGQSVVTAVVRDAPGDPSVAAAYVQVRFRLVPERPLGREVFLIGSFSGWQVRPAYRMRWHPEQRYYEGEALVKQGWHAYRYVLGGDVALRANAQAMPRSENVYTALVYFRDSSRGTDRLLGIGNQTAP